MKVLLDTNAYSALLRGHPEVSRLVRDSTQMLFSTVVLGELLFGFRNGSRYEANLGELRRFLDNNHARVLPVTWETSERFGQISAELRRSGTPIPVNDVWIAAHSIQNSAVLLSFDRHFNAISGLEWWMPGR